MTLTRCDVSCPTGSQLSLEVTVDPLYPSAVPGCRFLGAETAAAALRDKLAREIDVSGTDLTWSPGWRSAGMWGMDLRKWISDLIPCRSLISAPSGSYILHFHFVEGYIGIIDFYANFCREI